MDTAQKKTETVNETVTMTEMVMVVDADAFDIAHGVDPGSANDNQVWDECSDPDCMCHPPYSTVPSTEI